MIFGTDHPNFDQHDRGNSRFTFGHERLLLSVFILACIGAVLVVILLSFSQYTPSATGEAEWSGEIQISDADSYAGTPAVDIDGADNAYVVWEEGSGFFNESREIHFMKMAPDGEVLINRSLASSMTLDSAWPDIAVEEDGTSHVIWQDSNPLHRNIFYMAVTPDGDNLFTTPIAIAQGTFTGAYTPSIDVDPFGHVHIVWLDLRVTEKGPDHEVYYTELDPSLAEGRSGIVTDEDICLIDDTQISSNLMIIDIFDFFEFMTGYKVLEYPPFPDVAADSDGYVNVVWTDARDGNPEVYYSLLDPSMAARDGQSSDLTTLSLVNNSRLTWNPSLSLQPMIAVGPDNTAHIAFTDNLTDSYEVYYATVWNMGTGFNSTLQQISLSDQEPSGLSPITVDHEGNAYISWRDRCCEHFEILISKIAPDGEHLWDKQRVSHSDSTAGSPPTVVDSNLNPTVFWQDNRTSTYQIYYNRTVMFPDLSIDEESLRSSAVGGTYGYLEMEVRNSGNLDAISSISVQAGDDIWQTPIFLEAGEERTYTYLWKPEVGDHRITIHLDPENTLTESWEENNHFTTMINVPLPPIIGVTSSELVYGEGFYDTYTSTEHSIPMSNDICWLNLSIHNRGGSPSGDLTILVTGTHESGEMDPVLFTTTIDLNESTEEYLSFVLDPIPGVWIYEIDLDSGDLLDEEWKTDTQMNFSIEFLESPDPKIHGILLEGSGVEGEDHEIIVTIFNDGEIPASGTLDVTIDGEILASRFMSIQPGEQQNQTFSWEPGPGTRNITAVLDMVPDSSEGNNVASLEAEIEANEDSNVLPVVVASSIVIGLTSFLLIFTEGGKYNFYKLMVVPLYTRIKRGKVLDHFMRGQVYGFIKANPGAHYNLIRRKLEINNGALAYHIAVLEREKFIRSRLDGTLKRFYPSDMNLPTGHELTEMERKLIDVVRANPGFSQKEIALTLGLSPQVVNYHIKSLARNHVLRLTRVGKRTLCYINEIIELDS